MTPANPAALADSLLPNVVPELRAARAAIQPLSGKSIRCDLVLEEGQLSSLEFNRSPKHLGSETFEVTSVTLLADVMQAAPHEATPVGETPLLDQLRERIEVSDVKVPVGAEQIEQYLRNLPTTYPEDYATLLRETDGFRSGPWEFRGTGARHIAHPGATWILTAETEDSAWAVCFKEDAPEPELLLMDEINDDFEPLGASSTGRTAGYCPATIPESNTSLFGRTRTSPASALRASGRTAPPVLSRLKTG
jgi:hypothetical protein